MAAKKNCLQSTLRKKKINTLFAGLGRSVLGKTVPSVLSTQGLWHSFSQYGPPGRQITYMSSFPFSPSAELLAWMTVKIMRSLVFVTRSIVAIAIVLHWNKEENVNNEKTTSKLFENDDRRGKESSWSISGFSCVCVYNLVPRFSLLSLS